MNWKDVTWRLVERRTTVKEYEIRLPDGRSIQVLIGIRRKVDEKLTYFAHVNMYGASVLHARMAGLKSEADAKKSALQWIDKHIT